MKINHTTFYIFNAMIVVVVTAGVLFGIWFLLKVNTDTTEVEDKATLTRLATSASLYHKRLEYYTGVCRDIGVPAGFRCSDSDQEFAIEVTVGVQAYICTDSTGFTGYTSLSKGSGLVCKR